MRNVGFIGFAVVFAVLATSLLAVAAPDGLTDKEIANAVDDQLIMDSATPADDIDVLVNDGIVELSGYVNTILAKDRAERLATIVKGVEGVVNNIEITPVYRVDSEIEEDVEDALLRDPVAESLEIDSSVEGGTVNLTGPVDSWEEKQLVGRVAKGVRGVKALNNDLEIDFTTDRSASEIRTEIEDSIRWDAYLDGALITVMVEEDGNVTLKGIVGSAAEKDRAYRRGWVPGVKNLDLSDLEVKRWARDEDLRKRKYNAIEDPEIKNAIDHALKYAPRVASFDIDVSVDKGVATLRGTVDNLKAKRSAARYTKGVVGVWRVKNRIKVRGEAPSDKKIKDDLLTAIARNPYLQPYEITATVVDGTVYLYGNVDSDFEKAQADELAANARGVKAVRNQIDVGEPSGLKYDVYSPYVGTRFYYDYDWQRATPTESAKSDWEIHEDIKSELFWSPFVSDDDIKVTVEDGVAVLTGTVDTWGEHEAATDNAYEGGATDVDNNLKVEFGPIYYAPY